MSTSRPLKHGFRIFKSRQHILNLARKIYNFLLDINPFFDKPMEAKSFLGIHLHIFLTSSGAFMF